MLDDARTGDRPFLGHMPDDEDRDFVLLGELHDAADALAQLGYGSRRRRQFQAGHGLYRVDHDDAGGNRPRLLQHIVERRISQ